MSDNDRLEKAKTRAKKRAEELFKPAPKEIEEELKKETTLGTPKNLVRPDNKSE
ncbi:hypothetical protein [Teredinibacter franksiae]|jgi:hypothetical protein|uniref:hypothetical protein n=1 Tax=Teredinibacter franksiae TaxID=2761453 RepID=UPI0016281E41|nr:hypothetical protein [Teredinibacter franksiae]